MKNLKLFGFLSAVWVLAACSKDPKTYNTARIETFTIDSKDTYDQANQLLQADYMFVMDVSASMGFNSGNLSDPDSSKREEFLGGLVNFVDALDSQAVNYRFGFINGNVHAGRKENLAGRGFYKNILIDSIMGSSQTDHLVDELQDIGQTLNENTNLMLEATDTVMAGNKDRFVRDGSQLIYLFVSDTDDESPRYFTGKETNTTEYANRLIGHKGTNSNAAFVNARAIVAGVNAGCAPADDFGESTGARLADTARLIENKNRAAAGSTSTVTASQVSHCILKAKTEFPTLLAQLARDVSKPTNLFQLQVPNVDVHSIKVFVNGTRIESGTSTDANAPKFVYIPNSKSVKITPTPPASARIMLTYNQFFKLNGTPSDVKAIQVKANGAGIQLSATEGWTYNAADNRIEFHGETFTEGTRIQVSY